MEATITKIQVPEGAPQYQHLIPDEFWRLIATQMKKLEKGERIQIVVPPTVAYEKFLTNPDQRYSIYNPAVYGYRYNRNCRKTILEYIDQICIDMGEHGTDVFGMVRIEQKSNFSNMTYTIGYQYVPISSELSQVMNANLTVYVDLMRVL